MSLSHAATVARRLRIDVHDNNDNAWQRGPLGPIEWASDVCVQKCILNISPTKFFRWSPKVKVLYRTAPVCPVFFVLTLMRAASFCSLVALCCVVGYWFFLTSIFKLSHQRAASTRPAYTLRHEIGRPTKTKQQLTKSSTIVSLYLMFFYLNVKVMFFIILYSKIYLTTIVKQLRFPREPLYAPFTLESFLQKLLFKVHFRKKFF